MRAFDASATDRCERPHAIEGRHRRASRRRGLMRPNVGLKPATPQQAAGTRIDPPVSVPIAKSASPAATTAAEPLDEPPGHAIREMRIERRSGVRVDAGDAVGELVQVRFADDTAAGGEQRIHDDGVMFSRRNIRERTAARARRMTRNVDRILNSNRRAAAAQRKLLDENRLFAFHVVPY